MTELRIYHWASMLIPGFVILAVTVLLLAPICAIMDFWSRLSPGELALSLLSVSILAYVVGTAVWGVAYWMGADVVSLQLWMEERRQQKEKKSGEIKAAEGHEIEHGSRASRTLAGKRYQRVRLHEANAVSLHVGAAHIDSYFRFRLALLEATQKLEGAVGRRIISEWEYLGLLQSLLFVWAAAAAAIVLTFLLRWFGLVSKSAAIPSDMGPWPLVACIVLWLASDIAYTYRNKTLAWDVALARHISAVTP